MTDRAIPLHTTSRSSRFFTMPAGMMQLETLTRRKAGFVVFLSWTERSNNSSPAPRYVVSNKDSAKPQLDLAYAGIVWTLTCYASAALASISPPSPMLSLSRRPILYIRRQRHRRRGRRLARLRWPGRRLGWRSLAIRRTARWLGRLHRRRRGPERVQVERLVGWRANVTSWQSAAARGTI